MIKVERSNPRKIFWLNKRSIIYIDPHEKRATTVPNTPKGTLIVHIDNKNTVELLVGLNYKSILGMVSFKKAALINNQLDLSKVPTEIIINPQKILKVEDRTHYRMIIFCSELADPIYVLDEEDEIITKIDKALINQV